MGDLGLMGVVYRVQDLCNFAGGRVFGVALYRARVLARRAAALLAVSGVITIALAMMPDAFYQLLAWPRLLAVDHVRHRHQDEPSTVDGLPATQRCHPGCAHGRHRSWARSRRCW